MERNIGTRALVALFLLTTTMPVRAAEPDAGLLPSPLPLAWCIERAHAANPAIGAAVAAAEAARHRVRPAGSLDDPRLAYAASNVPTGDLDFASTPLSGHQFGLNQKLPFPGLLGSRKRVAEHRARASDRGVEDQRLIIDAAVEMAWAELGFAQRALDITEDNIDLLRQLAGTAESRYQVGSGLQQDVLRAQVELTALLQERLRRREAIEIAAANLIELLDLPAETPMPRTAGLAFGSDQPDLPGLLARVESRSARLAAAGERVEAARAQVAATRIEGFPDLDLGLGYRVRRNVPGDAVGGDDFLSLGVTVRLPVDRGKWRARIAERRANLRRAEADLRATRAGLFAMTRRGHAELVRASSEEALLATGLVPQARQSLESSRSAYQVGRIEFLSLLDSQVRLLRAELRLERAIADKRLAFASLEAAVGEKLR